MAKTAPSSRYIFIPISAYLLIWSFLMLILVSADFMLTIVVQCFRNSSANVILYIYFDKLMPFVFLTDILISFNTCFMRNGIVVYSRKQIAKNYVQTIYFYVDIISLIASIIQFLHNSEETYDPAFNFVVFVKIIKVYHFDKLITRYALTSFNVLLIYQVLKNIFLLAFLCHIMGSFFFYLDILLIEAQW